MTVDNPGFHAHSGWYFRREPEGSVRILAPDSLGPGAHQVVTLDASTWASVAASVSAPGESGETYRAALAAHMHRRTDEPAQVRPGSGPMPV